MFSYKKFPLIQLLQVKGCFEQEYFSKRLENPVRSILQLSICDANCNNGFKEVDKMAY